MRKVLITNCLMTTSPISGAPVYCSVYILIDNAGQMLWHENLFLANLSTRGVLNTSRSHAADLLSFTKMAQPLGGWRSITPAQMNGYIRGELVQRRQYAPATLARHINTIKAFFQWLNIKGYLLDLPDFDWAYKHLYRNDQPNKTAYLQSHHSLHSLFLDQNAFELVLAGVRSKDRFLQLRDEIVLKLGYECGLRAHEVLNLDTTEVRKSISQARERNSGLWATTRIKLLGKGSKTREIYVGPKLSETIANYIQTYRTKQKHWEGSLICKKNGLPITDVKHASTVFNKACRVSKIPRHQHQGYQRLRKCFATNLVQECWDAGRDPWVEVPRRLGHRDIETTKKYVQFEALLNSRSKVLSELRMLDRRFNAIQRNSGD